jgi:hypothetical protein
MAIYKVQGPNGEIITIEGPDGSDPNDVIAHAQTLYKPKEKTAMDYAKDFGKATTSLADTGLNAVTGMLDYGAYNLARASGLSPERATQETTSPKDVLGRAFGITQDPAYQSEASRRLMTGMGQGIEQYAVKPLSSATGLPEQDVSSMVNSAMLGAGVKAQPYINRAGQRVAQTMYNAEPVIAGAAKTAVTAPYQFGKGLVEGLINKEYNPATSAMVPLRETYTPQAAAQRFMGQLPGVPEQTLSQLESQARPTSELVGGRTGQVAQAISPKTLAGETLVPLQGQAMQAFGERVGRGVRTNPGQALVEAGVTALTGIPFKTISQGVGELGARYLGAKTGFMPGFSEKLSQAQGRAGIQGQMPQTPLLTNQPTVAGPVSPATMYVAPEGIAGTNINQVSQAGAQQKYAPQPVPQPVAQTPKEMAIQTTQQIASSKVAPVQQAIPAPTPTPAPAPVLRQPVVTTPAPKTEVSFETRKQELINKIYETDDKMTNLRDNALENRLKPDTPEGNVYRNELDTYAKTINDLRTELEKVKQAEKEALKAEKKTAKKSSPNNVSQMMTQDPSNPRFFPSKEKFEQAAEIFGPLSGKPFTGSYPDGGKIINIEAVNYPPGMPTQGLPQTKISATNAKTGERVPVGKTWTDSDPEPLGARVRNILDRNKGNKK